jgi:hypothetical protein
MAELGIAASIVGVTASALHGIRLLLDGLKKIEEAPEVINGLKDDIHSVDVALTSLEAVKDGELESLGET